MDDHSEGSAGHDFADFMRGNADRLCRVAYLLTGNRSRAEEMVRDALARTYRAWKRVRSDDAYAYTRKVLINLHTDWWRRRWREYSVAEVPDRSGVGDLTSDAADREALATALRALTPRERAVIVLRYYLDLTEAQAAAELGISIGTVKSTAFRALRKLRVSPTLADGGQTSAIAMEGTP
ncbi:MAG: SigE family RNA polymerase sigma factor [Micromonosporaceae bacterium]